MNVNRISMVFVSFYLIFLVGGIIRIVEVSTMIRERMLEERRVGQAVKAGGSHGMDDFRLYPFEVKETYAYNHLISSLEASESRFLEHEKKEMETELFMKAERGEIQVSLRGRKPNRRGGRSNYFSKAKIEERNFFYGYEKKYHRTKKCKIATPFRMQVFSSMEEAAEKGFFPCEYCILGVRG